LLPEVYRTFAIKALRKIHPKIAREQCRRRVHWIGTIPEGDNVNLAVTPTDLNPKRPVNSEDHCMDALDLALRRAIKGTGLDALGL
jgi:hypothetical protein